MIVIPFQFFMIAFTHPPFVPLHSSKTSHLREGAFKDSKSWQSITQDLSHRNFILGRWMFRNNAPISGLRINNLHPRISVSLGPNMRISNSVKVDRYLDNVFAIGFSAFFLESMISILIKLNPRNILVGVISSSPETIILQFSMRNISNKGKNFPKSAKTLKSTYCGVEVDNCNTRNRVLISGCR